MTASLVYREENPEVYYSNQSLVVVDDSTIAFLKSRAASSPRKQSRLCMHANPSDALHQMLIIHHRDVYVRPHRHLAKAESLQILEGAATVALLDEHGGVNGAIRLADPASGKPFFYRIPANVVHTLRIESEWLVFMEVTSGPFVRSQTEYMAFSPDGSDVAEVDRYLKRIAKEGPAC
ncbi:MAG TPA: WbuC family cupin fold metalloprotein [Candidatus Baltobacteraceae bacterium]